MPNSREQAVSSEQLDSLVTVLDLVRSGRALTRPHISRASGLGRSVVTLRVEQLLTSGLLVERKLGESTGGRAPRSLAFDADAGIILVADIGATGARVALVDLSGRIVAQAAEDCNVSDGPDAIMERVHWHFQALLEEAAAQPLRIWGVGVGLPGPVEFARGRVVSPPIMPGWDLYPVREYFVSRYDAPVWVDNDVNIRAVGELRAGLGVGERDLMYVKIGTGIGAGLISSGVLHRGAQGIAGDIGHLPVQPESDVLCRCGRLGCLEALAGAAAIAREGTRAAREGRSGYLAEVLQAGGAVDSSAVIRGASHGDPTSRSLLAESASLVGSALSSAVNFFNPSLIVIGGRVALAGDSYLAGIRQEVLSRSLPLATRELRIDRSPLGDSAGLVGAAFLVIDLLLSPHRLAAWIGDGSPHGRPDLVKLDGYAAGVGSRGRLRPETHAIGQQ